MPEPDAPRTSSPPFPTSTPVGDGGSGGGVADKLSRQLRQQALRVRDQGVTKLTELAGTGKEQVASKLHDVAEIIGSIADPVEESYGSSVAGYVRTASDKVRSIGNGLRDKPVEDLVSASRAAIGNNPAIAIGTAALIGFAAARIAKGGLDDASEGENRNRVNQSLGAGATA